MASKLNKSSKKSQNTDIHKLLKSRLSLAKKFGKKWRDEVKNWLKDYKIESFQEIDHDDLYNQIQIPYIFSTIESNLPSMFETMPQLLMKQRGQLDRDFTEWVANVWDYLIEKLSLEELTEDAGIMFLITGLMSVKYGWTIETAPVEEKMPGDMVDDQGNPVGSQDESQILDVPIKDLPFARLQNYDRIYFSPESVFVVDDDENKIPYLFCHEVLSPDEVEERYGKKVDEETYINLSEATDDPDASIDSKDYVKSDLKRTNVYEYYGVLPKAESRDPQWKSTTVYTATLTDGSMLEDPKPAVKKPVLLQGNYGTPAAFWRFGEPKVLRNLEQDISLGRSMMSDYRDRQSTKVALPQGTEVDEVAFKAPRKFQFVRFVGQQYPQYIAPPNIPEAIPLINDQDRQDIQMASAQLDISRGGDQSIVKTATGQQIFNNAVEKRVNRKRRKIGKFIKALAQNLLVLCAENWDVDMFAKITDLDPQEILQNQYIEKLKQLGNEFDVEIEIESITNNKATKSAQAIAMYKELKGDPLINQEEVLKKVLEIGFDVKDFERFLNQDVTPDQVEKVLADLVQKGLVPPEILQQVMTQLQPQSPTSPGMPGVPGASSPAIPTNETMVNAQASAMPPMPSPGA